VRRRVIPIAIAAFVVGLLAYEVISAGSSGGQARPAPPLPSSVLQPPKATLKKLRGKPALINFWASWCEPCREEAPEIERLARSLEGGSAALVGVDYTDQADAARAFIRRYRWTFPILSDPNGTAGARYRFSGLPTTVVLDRHGRIVETLRGPQDVRGLREALNSAEKQ
jgi:cytochrome c biogenesis protein CcmG, thiol:disulfide interchange protein DsbE